MEYTEFVRVPFLVQAVQITEENFDDIFELIGKEVKELPGGKRYILIDRRIIPNGHKAQIGGWVTSMNDKIRYYSKSAFEEQFVERGNTEFEAFFASQKETDDILADADTMAAIAEAEAQVRSAPDVSGADL